MFCVRNMNIKCYIFYYYAKDKKMFLNDKLFTLVSYTNTVKGNLYFIFLNNLENKTALFYTAAASVAHF